MEAFWLIGEFQPEMHHCKVSLEVTVDWLFLASRVFFFFFWKSVGRYLSSTQILIELLSEHGSILGCFQRL